VPVTPRVRIFEDPRALAQAAAGEFRARAEAAIARAGRFTVALSGGTTPRLLFDELATEPYRSLGWERVHVFWADERAVPPDHPASNFGAADRALLVPVGVPAANVHRMRGEDAEPERAARDYEGTLRAFFGVSGGQAPRLDLVLLGMGPDGHTASLFPGSPALRERGRLVVAPRVERLGAWRITLTLPVLDAARCVIFSVAGADKAPTLARVLEGPRDPDALPAQAVAPQEGELVWLVDAAAAALLHRPPQR
jgi:6-phosphogluconolactonase